jgi:hypothetical protein
MSTENINSQEEQKAPSKEEVIAFFQEQIEVKKVQLELQEINAAIAVARAEELKALSFIAQITNPMTEKEEDDEPKAPRTLKKDK